MKKLKKILEHVQKILSCPICHKHYLLDEIEIIGLLDGIYLLQVKCNNKHQPITMTVVISEEPVDEHTIQSLTTYTKRNKLNKLSIKPIEIKKLTQILETFDGDFEKLWKK